MSPNETNAITLLDPLSSDDAYQRVVAFARHFGEPHTILAMHAALPLGLTPEIVHLIRINFVRDADWIAEADLLLSPLCREVGAELYEMYPDVREFLLDELRFDQEFGPSRVRLIAEFLLAYAKRAIKLTKSPEIVDFLRAQQWVALAYAHPKDAAESLALALRKGLESANRDETIRIANLTQVLATPLIAEEKVLLYAAGVEKLAAGDRAGAFILFEAVGPTDQSPSIGNVALPAPNKLTPVPSSQSIEVFFSYSYKDEVLRDELATHLSLMKRHGVIEAWHDREISAGREWANAIDDNLNTADIILLLVSANFLASDYCYDIEMQRAMERHEAREARVIPIILKPVDWSDAPFAKLQALPKNAKAVTTWQDKDEAFLNVAQGIRRVVEEMAKSKTSSTASETTTPATSTPLATSGGLTDRQRRRLKQELDSLQQQYDLASTKLGKLRQAYSIETDTATKFQLEKQIQEIETELNRLVRQLEEIEQKLV